MHPHCLSRLRRFERWLIAAILLFAPFRPALAQDSPAPIRVEAIQFEGLAGRTPEEIIPRLATKIGEPYNPLNLREDIAGLATIMRSVRARTDPAPDPGGIILTFSVEEFPTLAEFQVLGNEKISTERIVNLAKMKPDDVVDPNVIRSMRSTIIQEYRKIGMSEARVDVNIAQAAPPGESALPGGDSKKATVQVIIDEGRRILIDDLRIEGNEAFTDVRLKVQLETKGSWLFLKNYYDQDAFDNDVATIRAFYVQNGYFDARVDRGEFDAREEKGKLVVTPVVMVEEGRKYRVGSVEVRGARLFSRDEVLEPFSHLKEEEFSGKSFSKALEEVLDLYQDAGFLTTRIEPEYEYDAENDYMHVTLNVQEDNRIYVGDVKIARPTYEETGEESWFRKLYNKMAPPVSDDALMREVLLKPGEVYGKDREKQTIRRLERLGVLQEVKIVNQPTANPRVHDALIQITEAPTGGFFGGVGFGDVSGAFVYVSFDERNLFGEARDFRVHAQVGTRASSGSISYLDRHFRDTDNTLSASIYYNRYLRPGWRENVGGTSVEHVWPLESEWEMGLRGRAEFVSLSERDGYDPEEDLDQSYPVVTGRLRFRNDTRFPLVRPTEGRVLEGAVEAGYADGPLVKFTGEGDYIYELAKGYTYRFNPSFGLLPYDSDTVGITERLFMGGSEDLRGFKFRGAGRRDEDDEDVPIGGAVKLLARNEFGFPVYDPVHGVYFIDAGMLGESPFDYEMPRVSTGVGLRLNLPKATIAFDLAVPILKDGDDQTQFVHFSFKGNL